MTVLVEQTINYYYLGIKYMKDFHCKLGNIEARTTNLNLLSRKEGEMFTVDIRCIEASGTVYSIAYFTISKDNDINLSFVGDRPLASHIDWNDFKSLVEMSYKFLKDNDQRSYV